MIILNIKIFPLLTSCSKNTIHGLKFPLFLMLSTRKVFLMEKMIKRDQEVCLLKV